MHSDKLIDYMVGISAGMIVLAAYALVGSMDYQDELDEAKTYQIMVCSGRWPNYKEIELECFKR